MSILAADGSSEYSMRAALRSAKFPEHAINAAMASLFPSPTEEPTVDDHREMAEWLDAVDTWPGWSPEYDQVRWELGPEPAPPEVTEADYREAMELADIREAIEDTLRELEKFV